MAEKENKIKLEAESGDFGILVLKTVVKLLIMGFALVQFAILPPAILNFGGSNFSHWIALILAFLFYFSMPVGYKTNEPYRMMEAWSRIGFAIVIAALFLFLLSPQALGGNLIWTILGSFLLGGAFVFLNMFLMKLGFPGIIGAFFLTIGVFLAISIAPLPFIIQNPALSIFWLTIAFLATVPNREISDEEEIEFTKGSLTQRISKRVGKLYKEKSVGEELKEGKIMDQIGNSMFLTFAVMGGIPIIKEFTLGPSLEGLGGMPVGQAIMIVIWLVSLLAGWAGGRAGRPYIGILMISFAMFAFTMSHTGVLGISLFGTQNFNMIQTAVSGFMDPIDQATLQFSQQIDLQITCITQPPAYCQAKINQLNKEKSKLEEGTTKSIEIKKEESTEVDPAFPLTGRIELENKGTFIAKNLEIKLAGLQWQNPADISITKGDEGWDNSGINGVFENCGGDVQPSGDTCRWSGELLQGQLKRPLFEYGSGVNLGEQLNRCTCFKESTTILPDGSTKKEVTGETDSCSTICSTCQDVTDILTYEKSSYNVRANANISYDYSVNVSLPVEIMTSEKYEEYLQTKKLKEITSIYNGGPVQVSIGTEAQPIQDGQPSIGVFTIRSTQDGSVLEDPGNKKSVSIYFPKFGAIQFKYLGITGNIECDPELTEVSGEDRYKLSCRITKEIAITSPAKIRFLYTYDMDLTGRLSKSAAFTANFDYRFEKKATIFQGAVKAVPDTCISASGTPGTQPPVSQSSETPETATTTTQSTPSEPPETIEPQGAWTIQTVPESVNSASFRAVHFIDENTGWAVGGRNFLKKVSGGDWVVTTGPPNVELFSLHFIDANRGWVGGVSGKISKTIDNTANWETQSRSGIGTINDIYMINSQTGWAVGNAGTILKLNANGVWEKKDIPNSVQTQNLKAVHFIDNQKGWVAAGDSIIATEDGGETWTVKKSGIGTELNDIYFFNENNGWAVGNGGKILSTTDGGAAWNDKTNPQMTKVLLGVHFTSALEGWAVGQTGTILKTIDRGESWTPQLSNTQNDLWDVYFIGSTGWAVGTGGTILKYTTPETSARSATPKTAEELSAFKTSGECQSNGGHWCASTAACLASSSACPKE